MVNYQKYLVNRNAIDIDLEVISACEECNLKEQINTACLDHQLIKENIPLKIRKMPWSLRNQKISLSLSWEENGKRIFDGDFYVRECLKYIIVEAPWGQTTDAFLAQVGDDLGAALESLVPTAFGPGDKRAMDPEEVKKEFTNT